MKDKKLKPNFIIGNKPLSKEEIIQWLIDSYLMVGEKNEDGEDEGKCLLGALIEILKKEADKQK
jgi:hypothetical protein